MMENLAALCFRSSKPLSTDQLNEIDSNGLYKFSAPPHIPTNSTHHRHSHGHGHSRPGQQPSLLSTMERFVQSVDEMNETILIPCRLIDMEFTCSTSSADSEHDGENATAIGMDAYTCYNTLNSAKSVLLCGRDHQTDPMYSSRVKGHTRQASTTSNSSRGESEHDFSTIHLNLTSIDSDSGVEEEYSQQLSDSFHMHLNGLSKCLSQMTDVADGLTLKYVQDVGGGI